MSSDLSPAELFKYPWRVQTFLDKYKKGEPFKLHNGDEKIFYCNPEIVSWMEGAERNKLVGPILKECDFTTGTETFFKLSDLAKTPEFGGKGQGFGVRIEYMEIASINTQLESIQSTMAKNLSPSALLKYDWRIKAFLKKYRNGEPFEFMSGPKKILIYSEQVDKIIQKKRIDKLQGNVFLARNGNKYAITDLKMTDDFVEFTGFDVEAKEVKNTIKQLTEAKEDLAHALIPLKIGVDIYKVSGIQKTQGSPKSDFHFVDASNKEVVWISHKDGKRASDFQQWSGMTEKGIVEDSEIKDFIESVKLIYPLGMEKGITVGRTISNKTLKMKSVYGIDYGGPYGKQNVTLVAQGPIDINKSGQYYRICSNHVLHNGDEPKNDYEPIMVAMFRSDRSQFGVEHARFAIYPKGGRIINDYI